MQLNAPIYRLKRRARLLAKDQGLKHHEGLNAVAQSQGYRSWDHLSAHHGQQSGPARDLLAKLGQGTLTLLAARPGQGKTRLALEMALLAARQDPATFFTLDYSAHQLSEKLTHLGATPPPEAFQADQSDLISADYIIAQARPGFIAVDYLQLLDQRRALPPLNDQCAALRSLARSSGARILLISQIHRSFDASGGTMPGPSDIRLPNPLDLGLFDQLIFLHDGRIETHPA